MIRGLCFFGGWREVGGDSWPRSATLFLCPKINPKSYYQEKEKKVCLAFCCSGHKQQSGIKGVVGAQDLISARFSSHKHPFSCPGPRHLSLCEAAAWFSMEWPVHCSPWTQLPILTFQAWKISAHSCLRYLDPRQSLTWWLNIT